MTQDKEDFFSPEMVDERLDLSLLQSDAGAHSLDMAEANPDLQLIDDLRYFYGAEGTENVRSLQRVWERLRECRVQEQGGIQCLSSEANGHLRLLKPSEQTERRDTRFKGRRRHGRGLAALAAVLFLLVMVGSLFTIVHLMRSTQTNTNVAAVNTPSPPATPTQSTPIPGYTYPDPGKNIALSPVSSGEFSSLAWSPDGKHLATSTQGKVWIWNLTNGRYIPLLDMPPAENNVRALAWSPDGRYLAVGSSPIHVVDPASGKVLWSYSADYPYIPVAGHDTLVTALAWSPDGNMLAMATQHSDAKCFVNIWNIRTGAQVYTFPGQGSANGISSISWSDDSRYVASTDAQSVQAWDAHNGYLIFQQAINSATDVAWSPNSGQLAFVNNGTTEVWDVWAQKLVSSYSNTTNGVLAWSPNGRYLATASGSAVIIFDARNGSHLYTYRGNAHNVRSLAWSPDGNSLASGEGNASGYNFARVWSA